MPDLTQDRLPALLAHRLPGLDLGPDFVYPHYTGESILNIPSGICRLFGIPLLETAPLDEVLLAPLGEPRQVVIILMDALALHRLRRWLAAGKLPVWERLAEQGILAPLTSIVPSTTSSALTSLWTGTSVTSHAIAGYELWLREYGVIASMIGHRPISYTGWGGHLSQAGFDPKTFLNVPQFGSHLSAHGIKPYAFYDFAIYQSGLAEMHLGDVEVRPFQTPADLWISVKELMEQKREEQKYIWTYWGAVDGLSHYAHPEDPRVEAEFLHYTQAFEQFFLNELAPAVREETLLILTADHGQTTTNSQDPHYDLANHPNLTRRLHMKPSGENRMAYLFVRPGQTEAVREYIERTWPNQFATLEAGYALENGFFGPGEPDPRLAERLGDLIVIGRGNAYWWWANNENHLIGRHGGLSSEEMLVPFLAARLG